MTLYAPSRTEPNDEGFGLVEVLVSMVILSLLAIAFVPILVQGISQSAQNAAIATSTQIVNGQLTLAGSQTPSCTAVRALASTATTTDSRGVPLKRTTTTGSCPSVYPGTVSVKVIVVRTDTGRTVASADTLIFVSAG
ncbi:type II secretion system protein [Marisediminicola senii]|uniref:type II secretion system protein n=1 Tax=Marisediminicola senii TaxID=2711233 RepID=UPI0013ECDCA1|nr:prepilin-type N-terminal cleavage/methylation domain-containing protein [Marisediminicola senii]